ncbi:MAG: PDR/VanB family oxidoreductase [Rhodocyclaceae bacterium]
MNAMLDSLVIPMRVRGVRLEAEGIRSFELVSTNGSPLPSWAPGAHIEVQLPGGIARQYSLFNSPDETHCYRIAVKREPASRGGSACLHEKIALGDTLLVRAPRNLFGIDHNARRHVLIAGGIGITPILSMFQSLAARGEDVTLHYFARSRAMAAFADLLAAHPAGAAINCHFGLDEMATRVRLQSILTECAPSAGGALYVCGPGALMELVANRAAAAGWPDEAVHSESFGSALKPAATGGTFEVVFQRSGARCTVQAGQTILAAARAAGVEIVTSCEQGVCGACLTNVIEGMPEHNDAYLSKAERDGGKLILPCVSRCQGHHMVLDL